MNNRNRWGPVLFALVGVLLIAGGSVSTFLPSRLTDLISKLPTSAIITRYPNASIIFYESAENPVTDFRVTMTNLKFTQSLTDRRIAWRIHDDGQKETEWIAAAGVTPNKMLFVEKGTDGKFKIVAERPLPTSSANANAMIAEVMAK